VSGWLLPSTYGCLLSVILRRLLPDAHSSSTSGCRLSTSAVFHVSLFLPGACLSGSGTPSTVCIVEAALLLIAFLSWWIGVVVAAPCGGRVGGACNGGEHRCLPAAVPATPAAMRQLPIESG